MGNTTLHSSFFFLQRCHCVISTIASFVKALIEELLVKVITTLFDTIDVANDGVKAMADAFPTSFKSNLGPMKMVSIMHLVEFSILCANLICSAFHL